MMATESGPERLQQLGLQIAEVHRQREEVQATDRQTGRQTDELAGRPAIC
jgi:hypothetical protein